MTERPRMRGAEAALEADDLKDRERIFWQRWTLVGCLKKRFVLGRSTSRVRPHKKATAGPGATQCSSYKQRRCGTARPSPWPRGWGARLVAPIRQGVADNPAT